MKGYNFHAYFWDVIEDIKPPSLELKRPLFQVTVSAIRPYFKPLIVIDYDQFVKGE